MNDFASVVQEAFRNVTACGLSLVETLVGGSFDNAAVTFRSAEVLIRVVRERGAIYAQCASTHHADEWFDASLVAELLEDSPDLSFMNSDGAVLLSRFARFLNERCHAISELFSPLKFAGTRDALRELEKESANRRFGL